jgi:hypothetical protein
MSEAKVLLGLLGMVVLVWGIGTATRVFANPIFASFWVISEGMAEVLSYVGSGIGGLLLAVALIVHYQNTDRRISKTSKVASSQTMLPISKVKVLSGLIGIVFLVWAIGVPIHLWGNPIFAPFWVASYDLAHALSYVGTGIGALLLALAVMFYLQKTSSRTSKNGSVTALQKLRPMSKATMLLGSLGMVFLVWGIGTATRVFANPMFAPFMIISEGMAEVLSYVGSGIGGLLLAVAVIVYTQKIGGRIGKVLAAGSSQILKRAVPEFYEDSWQTKPLQQAEEDYVASPPFVIISGWRTRLGLEALEKIVEG